MKATVLAVLLGCAPGWTGRDTALQVTTVTLLGVDGAQTIVGQARGDIENNPILGRHPTPIENVTYFLACSVLHTAVAILLPDVLRFPWQLGWTIGEAWQVGSNAKLGLWP